MPHPRLEKVYLGDAVYAEWDGDRLVLTIEDGCSVQETIILEDFVIRALNLYIRRITGKPT